MGRQKHQGAGPPTSIRISECLRQEIEDAAKELQLSVHDTMRMAMEIGLLHFQQIDYDIAAAVLTKSQTGKKPQAPPQATDPTANTAGSPSPTTGKPLKYATKTAPAPANVVPLPRPTTAPPSLPSDVAAEEAPPYGSKKKGGA